MHPTRPRRALRQGLAIPVALVLAAAGLACGALPAATADTSPEGSRASASRSGETSNDTVAPASTPRRYPGTRRLVDLTEGDKVLVPSTDVPAIAAQPSWVGKEARIIGGYGEDDASLLLGYGDYGLNTGPIDILAVRPDGTVETLLEDFNTEMTYVARRLNDGATWIPAVDPRESTAGELATDAGGAWHTVVASITGLPVLEHVFDVAQQADGTLFLAGSRVPTRAENGGLVVDPSTVWTYAVVWRSEDGGVTWVEDIKHRSGSMNDSWYRMYGFGHSGDRLAAFAYGNEGPGAKRWVNTGDGWVEQDNVAPVVTVAGVPPLQSGDTFSASWEAYTITPGGVVTPVADYGVGSAMVGSTHLGEPLAAQAGYLFRAAEERPIISGLDGPPQWWTARATSDGALWLLASQFMGGQLTRFAPGSFRASAATLEASSPGPARAARP